MVLSALVDIIISTIDKGRYFMGLFLDFSKAFDTVSHRMLSNRLDKYGIRGLVNTWINSYLTNRKQFVSYNDNVSAAKTVLCGVPQGSILGPLLFLLYVNDIVNVSDNIFRILFADDTNVSIDGSNLNNMNKELCKLVLWLNINKCSLNIDKTHFMIFRSNIRNCHFNTDFKINS